MNRRTFLQNTLAGTALIGLGEPLLGQNKESKKEHLVVLHTNDVHSYIDPFPSNHSKNPNQGGVARRAALIAAIRQQHENVILLDAGDIFQGTPYFNFFGGELEFKLMSMMQYDVATLGNHDFDNGELGLLAQLPHANFSFVNSNYTFHNSPLEGKIQPYKILKKGGLKIGIFGLGIQLDGLVDRKNFGEIKYNDPVEIATDMGQLLKVKEKCDVVICLSHLGYQYKNNPEKIADVVLAAQTRNIDLILGGHTHTFLEQATAIRNLEDKTVLVHQVGCYGLNLGRIDLFFEEGQPKATTSNSILIHS